MVRPSQSSVPAVSASVGPTRTSDKATRTITATPSVRPMATSRTFHHGRPSSMSYARLSAPTIETSAAELLHNAPATPNVSSPPFSLLASRRICSWISVEDLRRDERAERATDIVGDVRERKEAREGEQKQDRRKQREEEVVRQLSR